MLSRRKVLSGAALGPLALALAAQAADPVRVTVGVLPFGTVLWEVETIRRAKLDQANGFAFEPVKLASNEAARIAFQAGQVDTIVTDLLWAARLRNEGRRVKFLPYSATEGGVMVPPGSSIRGVADLSGKRIGVAGGALDKSWLLLRAHARERAGLDLATAAMPAFGAPPLLANKLESGELDAALLYWNYCARLEAKGYRRLIGAGDIAQSFGLEGEIALIGYIFDESILQRRADILDAITTASGAAKALLARSEPAWAAIRPLMSAEDDATFEALRRYFLEGVPERPVTVERADAERLYAVLAKLGGEKLVGPGTSLPQGLYWGDARDHG
jgi:NitT/TauT family transport system substrate-binding protein